MVEFLFLALIFGIGALQLAWVMRNLGISVPHGFPVALTLLLLLACLLVVLTASRQ